MKELRQAEGDTQFLSAPAKKPTLTIPLIEIDTTDTILFSGQMTSNRSMNENDTET